MSDIALSMKVFKGIASLGKRPDFCVATIGNFDGVHRGHREILSQVVACARAFNGTALAVTFRPHPHLALHPELEAHLLNTYEEKVDLLVEQGLDIVIEEPFSREFSNMSPEKFMNEYLIKGLNVRVLYLGYDFAFGKERAGTVEMLKQYATAKGIEIHVVQPFRVSGAPVSSSLIRKCLDDGKMEQAAEFLGRQYFVSGIVRKGDGRGRTIGFPTANLNLNLRKLPKIGVYATQTFHSGKCFNSVTNVGRNPTFKGDGSDLPIIVETHIFNFDKDIYGEKIYVHFHQYVREEQRFSGVESLVDQIKKDASIAQDILANLNK